MENIVLSGKVGHCACEASLPKHTSLPDKLLVKHRYPRGVQTHYHCFQFRNSVIWNCVLNTPT
jgi:hypothetical protein